MYSKADTTLLFESTSMMWNFDEPKLQKDL